jgi:leucyl-tRNA synthetase
LVPETIVIPVEVNGRLRSRLELPLNTPKEEVLKRVLADPKIKRYLEAQELKRFIYIPNKLLNLVV